MDVLTLLKSKNRCLLRFEEASLRFLRQTEDGSVNAVELALPRLEKSRERILKALDLFDRKLNEAIAALPQDARTPEFLDSVRATAAETDRILSGLMKLDDSVIRRIRACQERVSLELAASEKSRATISKFKSAPGTSGEGLDQTL